MVAGIIAEYNPFHKGHEYHIRKTKELTHGDFVIVVMSGDFVQRGEPSVMSKYIRTRQALLGGADLVLELPVCFATAAAPDFAFGGISLLDSLGVVDHISFGCEDKDTDLFMRIADVLISEPDPFKAVLNDRLRAGESFPSAREAAVLYALGLEDTPGKAPDADIRRLLSGSNNILALEYLRALKIMDSPIEPVMIRRSGDGYNEDISGKGYASASGIRSILYKYKNNPEEMMDSVKEFLPDWESDELSTFCGIDFPIHPDDFIYLIGEKVRQEKMRGGDLTRFQGLSEELANRILGMDISWRSFDEVCKALKTRQYTYSRISRALIHILLDVTGRDRKNAEYARILGFRRSASSLLKELKTNSRIPVITRVSDAGDLLDEEALSMFRWDIFASELYEDRVRAIYEKEDTGRFNEYKQSPIIV